MGVCVGVSAQMCARVWGRVGCMGVWVHICVCACMGMCVCGGVHAWVCVHVQICMCVLNQAFSGASVRG